MSESSEDVKPVVDEPRAEPGEATDERRRSALAKLALWTPPAMLSLMVSQRASASSLKPLP